MAHRRVRISSTLNMLLHCPAPAMATMASRCSCRSPGGPGALTGASLMCGSEEKPVLLRASLRMSRVTCLCCFPSSCALPRSFPFLWSGWSAPDCEERVRLFKASCFQRSWKLLLPVSSLSFADGTVAVRALPRLPRFASVCGFLPVGAAAAAWTLCVADRVRVWIFTASHTRSRSLSCSFRSVPSTPSSQEINTVSNVTARRSSKCCKKAHSLGEFCTQTLDIIQSDPSLRVPSLITLFVPCRTVDFSC